jgi:hypothetical protein
MHHQWLVLLNKIHWVISESLATGWTFVQEVLLYVEKFIRKLETEVTAHTGSEATDDEDGDYDGDT